MSDMVDSNQGIVVPYPAIQSNEFPVELIIDCRFEIFPIRHDRSDKSMQNYTSLNFVI